MTNIIFFFYNFNSIKQFLFWKVLYVTAYLYPESSWHLMNVLGVNIKYPVMYILNNKYATTNYYFF